MTLSTPEVTTYAYDLVGNLVRVDLPNGIVTEYVYDDLNRLDVMTHYAPDATPADLSDNDKIARYDYDVRADGRRTAVTETVWESGSPLVTTIGWSYDNLGRLIEEVYDSHDDNLDFAATYTYDLVGNRLEKTVDQGSDSSIDETITYTYDDNDRLLTEVKDLASGTDTTTTYEYGGPTNPGTEQTKKTVTDAATSALIQTVESTYNLQGRLSEVVIETYDSGNVVKRETTTYEYDENGIRVGSTNKVEVDDDADPQTPLVVESETETTYLNDPNNPTGYSQTIEEITRDAATQEITKNLVFTLGHDVIAQTEIDPAQAGSDPGDPLLLLYDGHGSTRFLADLNAAIQQGYSYDAYGNAIGFDPAAALTALLYSGEPFDTRINQQYLRARWYDLSTGRFNRLDPFAGNLRDPQSLHKYLYTHADPVNGIDPTGLFSLGGTLTTNSISGTLRALSQSAISRAATSGVTRYVVSLTKQSFKVLLVSSFTLRLQSLVRQQVTALPQQQLVDDLEYALLSKAVYNGQEGVEGHNWVRQQSWNDRNTGFKAVLFVRNGERVLAFAGTDDFPDVATDVIQAFGGQGQQYRQAVEVVREIQRNHGRIDRFVGHSLGGGLAAASALIFNIPAVTFNGAGVHYATVAAYDAKLDNAPALIKAYRVKGEILSTAQDTHWVFGLLHGAPGALLAAAGFVAPDSNGTNYWLPTRMPDLLRRHAIDEVIWGMQELING